MEVSHDGIRGQPARQSVVEELADSLNALNNVTRGESHASNIRSEKLSPIITTFSVPEVKDRSLLQTKYDEPDTSRAAYIQLLAAIVFESIIFGIPLSYGVFQEHYSRSFSNGARLAPYIGVLSEGITFLGAPGITYCCQKFNLDLRWYIFAGWAMCVLSLLTSIFCTTISALIITQGLMYGIGTLLLEMPLLTLINTWFEKRRGLAYGLIFAGCDVLAIGYTFLIAHFLRTHGLKITMAVLVALVFGLGSPPMLVFRARNPVNLGTRRGSVPSTTTPFSAPTRAASWRVRPPTKRYYKRAIFYALITANLLQSFAFYLPFIYLPSFTTDIGHSVNFAVTVLSVANLAQVFGEIGFGKLSDMIHVNYLAIVSTTGAALSTFLLWGLLGAQSPAALLVSAFLFGCFGSGFLALWARMGTLFGEEDAQMVYSTMCFGRGLGSIFSGPISAALLSVSTNVVRHVFGAGKYAGIVFFVGGCMTSSAIVGVVAVGALALKNGSSESKEKEIKNESGSSSVMSWFSKEEIKV